MWDAKIEMGVARSATGKTKYQRWDYTIVRVSRNHHFALPLDRLLPSPRGHLDMFYGCHVERRSIGLRRYYKVFKKGRWQLW
jgi:hypothetical protein